MKIWHHVVARADVAEFVRGKVVDCLIGYFGGVAVIRASNLLVEE